MNKMEKRDLSTLPGGHLIETGLAHGAQNKKTVESLLVSVALGWLQEHGLAEGVQPVSAEPEIELYNMLCRDREIANPYSRYNSLIRELVSFQRAYSLVWRGDKD